MAPVYKAMSTGPWIRGLNSATDPYDVPKGAVARLSNFSLRRRGALHTIDGSLILSAVNGIIQPTNQGAIEALFLFQPTGINPYYVDLQLDAIYHLGAPTGLAVVLGATGTLPAGTYYYVVTATDGIGGETPASAEVSIVNPGATDNNLSWNPVNWASGYNIYRSNSSGTETLLASVTTNSFVDNGSVDTIGPYTLSASFTLHTPPGTIWRFSFTTSIPNAFQVGDTVEVTGVTPSFFNQTFMISALLSSTSFLCFGTGSGPNSQTGSGGSVVGSGPASTIRPPTSDTTQVVVMRSLPVTQTSYNESSIVAIFPSTPGTVTVNPPGSTGGGAPGPNPGGGGAPIPGPGGGQLPLA